jgi:mono/diheme cytochrome c family protein
MKTISILVFLGAFLCASLALPQTAPTGNAENGKRLFDKDGCYECHGFVGQGTKDGARIGPPVLNVQGLIRYVRKPTGAMPAFTEKVLTDAELTDIYAYLRSLPAPKAIKDIPLLNDLK